jgi:subtilisin family serine protease
VGGDPVVWTAYGRIIGHLARHGTLVIAAASNEHVELSAKGRVRSAGSLAFGSLSNQPANDLRGLSEVPAGVPGAIAVAATNRITMTGTRAETVNGQYGAGRADQLSNYSNYGERIDISAPGGSRNFNVPAFDCLSAECLRLDPSNPVATDNPGAFGAWGTAFRGRPCNSCYVNAQGTSMATPQVSGVAVLALSANRNLTRDELVGVLRRTATRFTDSNATPPIQSDPSGPGYNYNIAYGAIPIANSLMGLGVVDAGLAVAASEILLRQPTPMGAGR